MINNAVTYRNYIFAKSDDGRRMFVDHELFQARFSCFVEQILNEYGLETALKTALTNHSKVHILDFGCGEGLYLHDVAAVLEARGLLAAADLNGIDLNEVSIATAEAFSQIATPPRPYLNFYLHNGLKPLEECAGLRSHNATRFDFIFAHQVIEYLPKARSVVERLYQSLKPGGSLFLRSLVLEQSERGWTSWHPSVSQIFGLSVSRTANPGIEVAYEQAEWLRQIGAAQVQQIVDAQIVGGQTKAGMQLLRACTMAIRNMKPYLASTGKLTEAQFDKAFDDLFQNTGPKLQGKMTFVDTLARKPLE